MSLYAHARAPARIGLAGGGTDLPAWTRERVGRCLSLAIKSYTHAVAISRSDGQVVASYRRRDTSTAATEIANGLVRESALLHGWESGFEIHTLSELSSRGTGLGVSSSIAVALAACFRHLSALRDSGKDRAPHGDFVRWALRGEPVRPVAGADHLVYEYDPEVRTALARDAWTVEIDRLRRPIGRQDHMAAAHGGLRLYEFSGDEARVVESFTADDARWVAGHLLLVRLPGGHDSRRILSGVKSAAQLESSAAAVEEALRAVRERNAWLLGHAFVVGHESKRSIAGAVPDWIDAVVSKVLDCRGVHGCKVAGAGGGGHLIAACEPGAREAIALATRLEVRGVEPDLEGARSGGW